MVDQGKNRVLRFNSAHTITTNGPDANVVFGQQNFTSQSSNTPTLSAATLNSPWAVAVDTQGNLYVADASNHRVLRYNNGSTTTTNGNNADIVFGQPDMVSGSSNMGTSPSASTLNSPRGVALDGAGNLFISDRSNNRVLRVPNAPTATSTSTAATIVFGQTSMIGTSSDAGGRSAATLSNPVHLTINNGSLYVLDAGNHRVMRFDNVVNKTTGATAEVIFGQQDATSGFSNTPTRSASTFSSPIGIAVDGAGNLFVGDASNRRVTRFANASSAGTGVSAVSVLGQPSFTSTINNFNGGRPLNRPFGNLAIDQRNGKAYLADFNNHRVLRYALADLQTNNPTPDLIFGQTGIEQISSNRGGSAAANTLANPRAVAVDANGTLYIAEEQNHRVLRFNNAHLITENGPNADGVYGQANFTNSFSNFNTGSMGIDNANPRRSLFQPSGVAIDAQGNLFVADYSNNRVLRFNNAANRSSEAEADIVFGQSDFTSRGDAVTQTGFTNPFCVAVDNFGNLYVADANGRRALRFNSASTTTTNGNQANAVWGQNSFTANTNLSGTQNGLGSAFAVFVDQGGNLYVADQPGHRVVRYANASTATGSAQPNANLVLGQPDFTGTALNNGGISAATMNNPSGVALDAAGNLYVTDATNNRLLRFPGIGPVQTQTLSLSTTSLNFGTIAVGATADLTVTITSVNQVNNPTLTANSTAFIVSNGGSFLTSTTVNSTLGGTATIRFTPQAVGTFTSTITITQGTSTATINVSGQAIAVATPTITSISGTTASGCVITWGSAQNATGYVVEIATDQNFANIVSTNTLGNVLTLTATGLNGNTTYFVRVRGTNANGASANSTSVSFLTLPSMILTASTTGLTPTSFVANWLSPGGTGALTYQVDVSLSNSFNSFVAGYNSLVVSSTSQSITGLTSGTTYFWRVRAVNASGIGVSSAVLSVLVPQLPILTSFSPNPIAQGQVLTLLGNNFVAPMTVNINGVNITATVASLSQASIVIPNTFVGTTTVSITTPGGSATSSSSLTIIAPPTITVVSPASIFVPSQGVNTIIALSGTNLNAPSAVTVTQRGANGSVIGITSILGMITSSSATQIVVSLPSTMLSIVGQYTFTVTNLAGSASGVFNINLPPPTITDLQPRIFAVGQTVTITGTNFLGASVVTLGGVNLTNFTVVNANTITAIVSGAPSSGVVTVQTGSGIAQAEFNYSFIATPTLSVNPNRLAITPITTSRQPVVLTLTGNNLMLPSTTGALQVASLTLIRPNNGGSIGLNSLIVNPFNLTLSSRVIQVTIPFDQLSVVGVYTISATTIGGTASTSVEVFQDRFGVSGTVRRTDVPNAGTDMSGIVVTLTGAGGTFTATTAVDGTYSMTNVPIGAYTVSYTSNRFFISPQGSSVSVSGTTVIPNPDVVRLVLFNITGSVSFVGLDGSVNATPQAEINFANTTNTVRGRVFGDGQGNFRISNIPVGRYVLTVASTAATYFPLNVTITDRDINLDGGLLRGSSVNRNVATSATVAVQGSANIANVTQEFNQIPATAGNIIVIVSRIPDVDQADLVLLSTATVNVTQGRYVGTDKEEQVILYAQPIQQGVHSKGDNLQQVQQGGRIVGLGDTVFLRDIQAGRLIFRPKIELQRNDTIRFNVTYTFGGSAVVNNVIAIRFTITRRPPQLRALTNLPEVVARMNERPGVQWFVSDLGGSYDFDGVDSIRIIRVVSSNEGLIRASNLVFSQFDRGRWLMTMPLERNTTGTAVITSTFTLNLGGFVETTTQSVRLTVTPASSVVLPIQDVVQTLHPNPASEELQIRFASKRIEDTKVSMVNMLGQTMMMQTAPRGSEGMTMNIRTLPSGTYRVVLQDSRGMATTQLVVVR